MQQALWMGLQQQMSLGRQGTVATLWCLHGVATADALIRPHTPAAAILSQLGCKFSIFAALRGRDGLPRRKDYLESGKVSSNPAAGSKYGLPGNASLCSIPSAAMLLGLGARLCTPPEPQVCSAQLWHATVWHSACVCSITGRGQAQHCPLHQVSCHAWCMARACSVRGLLW